MGRFGSSDTAANYAEISTPAVTAFPWSMSAWIKPPDVSTMSDDSIILSVRNSAAFGAVDLRMALTGQFDYYVYGGTDAHCIGATSWVPGQWYHIAGYSTSATAHFLYVNGVLDGSIATNSGTSFSMNNTTLSSYHSAGGRGQYLSGTAANVAVWNVALTPGEIWQLSQGIPTERIRPQNMKGLWLTRDDNGATVLYDRSPFRRRTLDLAVTGSLPLDANPPRMRYPIDPKRRYWTAGGRNAGTVTAFPDGWQTIYPSTTGTQTSMIAI